MPSTPRRRRGLVSVALLLVALVATGAMLWSADDRPAPALTPPRTAQIDVLDGPGDNERIQIDATLYAPLQTPAPAVLLSHGFGEDKNSTAEQAKQLARRGFTVLTYSSRGFGESSGRVALNSPEYEVKDAQQILDWLARQPEVLRDRDRDPKVGVTGESYGGALSLLLAGTDRRVDAVAPVVTYNDLEHALLPNNASTEPILGDTPARGSFGERGVFKQAWAGLLFSAGTSSRRDERPSHSDGWPLGAQAGHGESSSAPSTDSALCGNFTTEVCAAYTEIAETGTASDATRDLLASVSPKSVTKSIKAPTLIVQGERDTLFGLDQSDANARQIAEAGAPVKTIWYAGGHDGDPPSPQVHAQIANWFAFHLGGVPPVPDPGTGFVYDVAGERRRNGEIPVQRIAAPAYPGIHAEPTSRFSMRMRGPTTRIINPPGGSPASTSSLPGAGEAQDAAGSLGQSLAKDWPGQVAVFTGVPAPRRMLISGVPRTRLAISSVPDEPTSGEAVLFTKLYDVDPEGSRSLVGKAVAPLRVADLPSDGSEVEADVALPGVVHSLQAGHRLELAVSTTDQAYKAPTEPAVYEVGLAGPSSVTLPTVPGRNAFAGEIPTTPLLGIGIIGLLAVLGWVIALIRRRLGGAADQELTETPLVISDLSKSYEGSGPAVKELSLRIERGQVVGLLGPNGAGKTTTLRMLLGLVRPNAGKIQIFGHRVTSGAPVLSRTGCLVEAPGFLPYLSGSDNLRSYWAATGRPVEDAHFDDVLSIAGLGDEVHRSVRTYSKGMRQRLAIAQAMLGLPDLLVLDEPATGLDPPQIRQLREVLQRFAASGRAVLLCSHLLAEVEQTCTHVVVMHQGELVTSGTVENLVSADRETTFWVDDAERAADALHHLEGIGPVNTEGDLVHADLGTHSPAVAVNTLVSTGISVSRVGPRRRLEDTFLQLVAEERD